MFDNAGAPVQSSDTALVVVLPVTGGVGTKEHTLTAAELGSPTGAATFKFKASRGCRAAGMCAPPPAVVVQVDLAADPPVCGHSRGWSGV